MVKLESITWQELEKIIKVLENQKNRVSSIYSADSSWYDSMIKKLSQVQKQPFNIEVGDFSKEDLKRISILVDMWNVLARSSPDPAFKMPIDPSMDLISTKLQKAYFKIFNDKVYSGGIDYEQ